MTEPALVGRILGAGENGRSCFYHPDRQATRQVFEEKADDLQPAWVKVCPACLVMARQSGQLDRTILAGTVVPTPPQDPTRCGLCQMRGGSHAAWCARSMSL